MAGLGAQPHGDLQSSERVTGYGATAVGSVAAVVVLLAAARAGPTQTGEVLPPPEGAVPVLVLVVAAAVAGALRGGFTDLFVYQYGGRAVLDGLPLYESGDPVTGLPFTYPPFAAVVMVPLALLPAWLAAALWTGASVGALAAVVVVVRRALGRPAPGWLVALVTARCARPGAGVAEPHVRAGQPVPDAGGAGRPAPAGTALVGRAGGHRGGREADPARVRRAAGAGRTSCGGGTGGAGLRRHRRGRVRGGAGLVGDVLDRRPASTRAGSARRRWPTTSRCTARSPGCSTARRRPCCGSPSPRRSRSRSWSSAPPGGAAATGCSAPAWRRWRCCSPRRSRGRTTGCGRCRSRWCCGSAAGGRPPRGPRCSWPARSCGRPTARAASTAWSPPDHVVGNAYLLAALALSVWAAAALYRGRRSRPLPASQAFRIADGGPKRDVTRIDRPCRRRSWTGRPFPA